MQFRFHQPRFLSLILISLLLPCGASNAFGQWAMLKGQFVFGDEGTPIPKREEFVPRKDVAICGKNALLGEALVINKKNRGIKNIILWAYKPSAIHPDLIAPPKKARAD